MLLIVVLGVALALGVAQVIGAARRDPVVGIGMAIVDVAVAAVVTFAPWSLGSDELFAPLVLLIALAVATAACLPIARPVPNDEHRPVRGSRPARSSSGG